MGFVLFVVIVVGVVVVVLIGIWFDVVLMELCCICVLLD